MFEGIKKWAKDSKTAVGSFLNRAKPLAAFRETRGLVAGSMAGIYFGLLNIFRVPMNAPIFGKIPAIATSGMVVLASLLRIKKNLNQYESPELTLQENIEREFLIKSSSKIIFTEINKLTLTQRTELFGKGGISQEDWDTLQMTGNATELDKALKNMYGNSSSNLEKYSFSMFCALTHFFGHFSETVLEQVFADNFELADYPKSYDDFNNLWFWGLLIPFAAYNALQTGKEVKDSYENPSHAYMRQKILQKVGTFKEKTNTEGLSFHPEQSLQHYAPLT